MVVPGELSMADLATRMSSAPAQIAGLAEHGQGALVGAPANLVLVDPAARVTVDRASSKSLSRNNPWHGRELQGGVIATFLRGVLTHGGLS